jgi:thiamine pyrophosphokinase
VGGESVTGKKVLGVLSGHDMPDEQLRHWVESADVVWAADGGANRLYEIGHPPALVIGDLDSARPEALAKAAEIIRDPDQDDSDCDKLLRLAEARGLGSMTLAALEGDLPDHAYGVLHSAAKRSLRVDLAYRRGIGTVLCGPFDEVMATSADRRVSVLPLGPCEGVTLRGVAWPLDHASLSPGKFWSVSNRTVGASLQLSARSGDLFIFIETDGLPHWKAS